MPVIQVAALEDVSLTKIQYAFLALPNPATRPAISIPLDFTLYINLHQHHLTSAFI
jgi:hypothetical protein